MSSKKGTRKKEDMNQEKKKSSLYLGDRKFYSKLFKFYEWFFIIALFLVGCVFFYDGAYLPGVIILVLSGINLPPVKKMTGTIPRIVRIFINIALIVLFVQSIGLSS